MFTLSRKWNISPKKVFKKLGRHLTYRTSRKSPTGPKDAVYSLKLGDLKITPMKFDLIRESTITDPLKLKFFSTRSHFTLDMPCSVCGTEYDVEMHHIRHLRKSSPKGKITSLFLQMRRKQIPVCKTCHRIIHKGEYDGKKLK